MDNITDRTGAGRAAKIFFSDPATMTPSERFREVAALLATGLRRLAESPVFLGSPAAGSVAEESAETSLNHLDVPARGSVYATDENA
jgi:hypothetical protein